MVILKSKPISIWERREQVNANWFFRRNLKQSSKRTSEEGGAKTQKSLAETGFHSFFKFLFRGLFGCTADSSYSHVNQRLAPGFAAFFCSSSRHWIRFSFFFADHEHSPTGNDGANQIDCFYTEDEVNDSYFDFYFVYLIVWIKPSSEEILLSNRSFCRLIQQGWSEKQFDFSKESIYLFL